MKKNIKPQLPAGFKSISGGGDVWDYKKTPVLSGVLKEITSHKSKQFKGKTYRRAIISTKTGDVAVFESAGLRALFDLKIGKAVAAVYLGTRKIAGRKQPMRVFDVGSK